MNVKVYYCAESLFDALEAGFFVGGVEWYLLSINLFAPAV